MSRVRISDAAEEDLAEIWFFIAQDNMEAADRFVDLVVEKCRLLTDSPKIGIERPVFLPRIRSFPVGNYVIFYRQAKGGIEVARVLSGRRDIPSIFKES